jgi:hypothetical protein
MNTKNISWTTAPIRPATPSDFNPEFLRTEDVRKVFGIKRGTLYNLAQLGKVKGVLLRIRGNKTGVRLWSVDSIRAYLHSEMEAVSPLADP